MEPVVQVAGTAERQPSASVAVVTGSSSGIGRTTALRLAEAGFDVVVNSRRNQQGMLEVAEQIRELGRHSLALQADICDEDARRTLVQSAFAWQGRVDAWINNAGADVLTDARALSFDDKLQRLIQTDLVGTITVSRMVVDRMLHQSLGKNLPSIVNVGWDQAFLGMGGDAGQMFCPIKGAVMAFSKSLALTVAPRIRVNCVAPGWIKTAWGDQADGYWDRRATTESMLGRWGTPEDVASTIAWLVSDQANFINGQCIDVNGGRRFFLDASRP